MQSELVKTPPQSFASEDCKHESEEGPLSQMLHYAVVLFEA
jgi:hypothetical protein